MKLIITFELSHKQNCLQPWCNQESNLRPQVQKVNLLLTVLPRRLWEHLEILKFLSTTPNLGSRILTDTHTNCLLLDIWMASFFTTSVFDVCRNLLIDLVTVNEVKTLFRWHFKIQFWTAVWFIIFEIFFNNEDTLFLCKRLYFYQTLTIKCRFILTLSNVLKPL